MNWNQLSSLEQIPEIKRESRERPVLIFKHSTRCNISRASLDRLGRNWKEDEMKDVKLYFLDLISFRRVSDHVAEEFGVEHESPQVLLIRDEVSKLDQSHFSIDYEEIKKLVRN